MKKKKFKNIIAIFLMLCMAIGVTGTLPGNKASAAAPKLDTPKIRISGIRFEKANISDGIYPEYHKADGVRIYLNGKIIDTLKKSPDDIYQLTDLTAGTTYKVETQYYKDYKQKQYYNSKTKKWVNKKPSKKQWKGKKTRTVKKTTYSKKGSTSFTTKTRKVARTDLDNIRAEMLQAIQELALDWNNNPPDYILDDDLNNIAQTIAETYDDNYPDKWIEYTWLDNKGVKVFDFYCSEAGYDVYSFDKARLNKVILDIDNGLWPEWISTSNNRGNIRVGIGYYNGCLVDLYMDDVTMPDLLEAYENYPGVFPGH